MKKVKKEELTRKGYKDAINVLIDVTNQQTKKIKKIQKKIKKLNKK